MVLQVAMGIDLGEDMPAANLYAVVTVLGMLVMLPFTLLAEAGVAADRWSQALSSSGLPASKLALNVLLSGLFHYTNNEV